MHAEGSKKVQLQVSRNLNLKCAASTNLGKLTMMQMVQIEYCALKYYIWQWFLNKYMA